MKTTLTRCFQLLMLLTLGGLLFAQAEYEDPVVYADQKTISEEALRAVGHVEIYWQDYVIYADAVDFNLKSRELIAEGRVTMGTKEMVLSGEKLVFNLKTQSGELVDTFGMVSPTVRYESDRLQQTDRETLAFQQLEFTSCAQILPRWSIRSRKGKIKKDKYIEMNGVLMRIKDVPVFYLPYLRYPLKKDGRASGFLIPGFGNSDLRGFTIREQFFWAIRPNIDMTFGLDYYGKLGLGISDEWRYLFRNASGSALFYYFKYREQNGVYNDTPSDYLVEADHKQTLPFLNSKLVLNVKRQSRVGFLRLMDSSFDVAMAANFQESLSLTSSYSNMSSTLRISHEETYDTQTETTRIIEYLPALSFNLNQQKLGKLPGFFSLSSGFSQVRRSGKTFDEEVEFVENVLSQRLTLTPSYELALFKLSWLSSSLELASKNSFYNRSMDPDTKKVVDQPLHLQYHTASFSLQGPVFSKVFEGRKRRIKHVIEPKLTFEYSTKAENRDRLIRVDSFDFPSYSFAGFSLTTRLFRKSAGGGSASPAEMLAYTIAQQYYFAPAEANRDLTIDGEFPRFSPLSHSLRLRPFGDFVLDASLEYNHYIRDLSRLNLHVSYKRPGAPLTGSLHYSIYRSPYVAETAKGNRDTFGGALGFDLQGFPLKLQTRLDYDFRNGKLLYSSLNASLDYQCLVLNTEFKVFTYMGKVNFQYRFGVSLGNLGMVGDLFGGE